MEHIGDELLIMNRGGLIRFVPAISCLFFGLPAMAVVVGGLFRGRVLEDWPTMLVALVIGVALTYLGIGFLTFARCTRLNRSTRRGETWIRLVHPWQSRVFKVPAKSGVTVRKPYDRAVVRYQAMLQTTGEAVELYEHQDRERVEQQARDAGRFMGIPVLLGKEGGDMPLEEGDLVEPGYREREFDDDDR